MFAKPYANSSTGAWNTPEATGATAETVASELVQAGIPKSHIVLAFRPPEVRKHTE